MTFSMLKQAKSQLVPEVRCNTLTFLTFNSFKFANVKSVQNKYEKTALIFPLVGTTQ
jgi:hypothetical protein